MISSIFPSSTVITRSFSLFECPAAEMETRSISLRAPLLFQFRSRDFPLPPFRLGQAVKKPLTLSLHPRLSPRCSLSNGRNRNVGDAINEVSQNNKLLQVVLVSPQIPGNTGCIARTCAASAVGLHLVGPLGFQIDDAKLKRAGLDYWPYVVLEVHDSWTEFRKYFMQQEGNKRLLAFTKRGTTSHSGFSYRKGDYLLFGSETSGLPPEALLDCKSENFGGGTIRIPMVETYVRCLNLSVSVGIALYEASRQLNYEQMNIHSQTVVNGNQPITIEDIFA